MKNLFLLMIILAALAVGACDSDHAPTKAEQQAADLVWCDRIGHKNVSCPGFEAYFNSPEGRADEELRHFAWCDRIGQVNVTCPRYGGANPTEHQKKERARFLRDCEANNHKYVGCPHFNPTPQPQED